MLHRPENTDANPLPCFVPVSELDMTPSCALFRRHGGRMGIDYCVVQDMLGKTASPAGMAAGRYVAIHELCPFRG